MVGPVDVESYPSFCQNKTLVPSTTVDEQVAVYMQQMLVPKIPPALQPVPVTGVPPLVDVQSSGEVHTPVGLSDGPHTVGDEDEDCKNPLPTSCG